ncbi:MAG: ATP-binding cassette domain-containing protein [Candidatus Sericytochromatia bacterium]
MRSVFFSLWLRYLGLVLSYAAQISLLLIGGVSFLPAGPSEGAASPVLWFWLQVMPLATVGLVGALLLEAFWHRPERWLYRNHALGPGLLGGSAIVIFGGILCGVCLAVAQRQGLLPWRWLSVAEMQAWGVYLAQQAVTTYAWMLWMLGAMVSLALLGSWIVWLSEERGEGSGADPHAEAVHWALQIDSVNHHFGRRRVLTGAWLKAQSGRVLGLLGRNGCGKSTLLQIVVGTLKADVGRVQLNGLSVRHLYREPEAVAYLPQASFLPRRWRVEQALKRFAGREGLALREDVRLAPLLTTRVADLSGGERRYLELCLVLALPRAFYLLDEPFSELEPLYKQAASQRIRAVTKTSGVIVTDHDYAQIVAVSDEILLMHQGQTQRVESLAELRGRYLPGRRPGFEEMGFTSFEEN